MPFCTCYMMSVARQCKKGLEENLHLACQIELRYIVFVQT